MTLREKVVDMIQRKELYHVINSHDINDLIFGYDPCTEEDADEAVAEIEYYLDIGESALLGELNANFI